MPTDLSTLLAELDAAWNAVGPLHTEPVDDGVDLVDAGLRCLAEIPTRLGVLPEEVKGVVALVNAYPQLREALCSLTAWKAEALEVEKQWDVQAVGRAIGAPLGADIRSLILPAITALRTLLEQRTEALRDISEHLPCDLPCKMKPAQGKCGECGAYRFETWCAGCTARAVLAAEVPRESGE